MSISLTSLNGRPHRTDGPAPHRRLPAAKTPQAAPAPQQIDLTDRTIDALVYELYALTAEEIAIVEGA